MLNFNFSMGGVSLETEFKHKCCYIVDNSGTGKTYSFMLIYNYCQVNKIDVCYFNHLSMDFSVEAIKAASIGKKVVIFDNADLYLTNEILENIDAELLLVSVKNAEVFNVKDSGKYYIVSNGNSIVIKGWQV